MPRLDARNLPAYEVEVLSGEVETAVRQYAYQVLAREDKEDVNSDAVLVRPNTYGGFIVTFLRNQK